MKKLNKKQTEAIFTKDKKFKKIVFCDLVKKDEKLHLIEVRGRGKNTSYNDTKYQNTLELLDVLNIDYVLGNDAPRGGRIGDYIIIKQHIKFNNFVKSFKNKKI